MNAQKNVRRLKLKARLAGAIFMALGILGSLYGLEPRDTTMLVLSIVSATIGLVLVMPESSSVKQKSKSPRSPSSKLKAFGVLSFLAGFALFVVVWLIFASAYNMPTEDVAPGYFLGFIGFALCALGVHLYFRQSPAPRPSADQRA